MLCKQRSSDPCWTALSAVSVLMTLSISTLLMTVSQVHQILTQWISQRKSFLSSCVSYENIPYKHRSSSGMLSVCEELSTASCRLIYHFGKLTNLVFSILFPLSRSLISSFTDNKGKNCFLNLNIFLFYFITDPNVTCGLPRGPSTQWCLSLMDWLCIFSFLFTAL